MQWDGWAVDLAEATDQLPIRVGLHIDDYGIIRGQRNSRRRDDHQFNRFELRRFQIGEYVRIQFYNPPIQVRHNPECDGDWVVKGVANVEG